MFKAELREVPRITVPRSRNNNAVAKCRKLRPKLAVLRPDRRALDLALWNPGRTHKSLCEKRRLPSCAPTLTTCARRRSEHLRVSDGGELHGAHVPHG